MPQLSPGERKRWDDDRTANIQSNSKQMATRNAIGLLESESSDDDAKKRPSLKSSTNEAGGGSGGNRRQRDKAYKWSPPHAARMPAARDVSGTDLARNTRSAPVLRCEMIQA
eukprot:293958-Rhodomonas_salina.3